MFRDDFIWGAASSAYQIEGKDVSEGAGECIWDRFVREKGRIADGADDTAWTPKSPAATAP